MTRGSTRTQKCEGAAAATRLSHAKKFLEVAELVSSEASDESHSVAAALAVLAGIAASDSACCSALGRRSRSPNHHDAEVLLQQIEPAGREAASSLRRLVELKDAAHYGFIHLSEPQLKLALRQAASLIRFASALK